MDYMELPSGEALPAPSGGVKSEGIFGNAIRRCLLEKIE